MEAAGNVTIDVVALTPGDYVGGCLSGGRLSRYYVAFQSLSPPKYRGLQLSSSSFSFSFSSPFSFSSFFFSPPSSSPSSSPSSPPSSPHFFLLLFRLTYTHFCSPPTPFSPGCLLGFPLRDDLVVTSTSWPNLPATPDVRHPSPCCPTLPSLAPVLYRVPFALFLTLPLPHR